MKKISIGENLSIDLETLIGSKLLMTANSGGGKSFAVRKFIESTHGHVHQIIIDPEGEFASLREKFDFILAGKGGDVPADPRSAELLARKVLELKADIIIDLYELKHHDRLSFVTKFFTAMINIPKEHWHQVLLVLDEAQIFAPEKSKAESLGAVVDMMSRGRKRGFCLIPATQSLAKLSKDVAAECNNKLIGRTGLDIHAKRAAEELGLEGKDYKKLRNLEPGQFYAFGPAISREVVLGMIGPVITTHQKAGAIGKGHAPAPTERIKSVLSKLADLPKEAEEELKDVASMRARISQLERDLSRKAPSLSQADIDKLCAEAVDNVKKDFPIKLEKTLSALMVKIEKAFAEALSSPESSRQFNIVARFAGAMTKPGLDYAPGIRPTTLSKEEKKVNMDRLASHVGENVVFGRCERKILGFLLMKVGIGAFPRHTIATMTGYSSGSGGFNSAIVNLSRSGLVKDSGGKLYVEEKDAPKIQEIVGDDVPHTLEDWIRKLSKCESAIYRLILDSPNELFSRAEIAEFTRYSEGSGGFNSAVCKLVDLGLVKKYDGGQLGLNEEISRL